MVEPKYQPLQFVKIKLFSLNYHGRILKWMFDGIRLSYQIQYADDKGDLRIETFLEDEIEPNGHDE